MSVKIRSAALIISGVNATLFPHVNFTFCCRCVQDVIKRLHGLTDPEGPRNLVNVTRNNTLSGACVAFSRKRFIPAKRLDVHFCGERAADSAGPSREFYRLVLKEIAESALFWGPENSKSLRLEFEGPAIKTFLACSRLLLWCMDSKVSSIYQKCIYLIQDISLPLFSFFFFFQ